RQSLKETLSSSMAKRMEFNISVTWLLSLALLINFVSSRRRTCAVFEFSSLPDAVVTTYENTTITFPFEIRENGRCNLHEGYMVIVTKRCRDTSTIICMLSHWHGTCIQPGGSCSCSSRKRRIHNNFTHTVTRQDNCTWAWSSLDGRVKRKEIHFNIL
ncbi:hypothetical protein BaRGS_00021190, partial [Batillaria attramentaria]